MCWTQHFRESKTFQTFRTNSGQHQLWKTLSKRFLKKNLVVGVIPNYTGDNAKHLTAVFNHSVQRAVKKNVTLKMQEQLVNHVKTLTLQGNILSLAAFEKEDIIWKSYMFNLKARTLKFLLNASIDTLPTAVNLKRWKKSPSDLCKLC